MRLIVATDDKYLRRRDGSIYSMTVHDYSFWRRYLQVFDEVLVLARVADSLKNKLGESPATGPNVSFLPLPTFRGPWQFLRRYRQLNVLVKSAIGKADACILRIPGSVATLLWRHLEKNRLSYGVEVIGNPQDSLMPGVVKSLLRPAARWFLTRAQRRQCQRAVAAAYATQYYLQQQFPPGCWSTHYSDVELPDEMIVDESVIEARVKRIADKVKSEQPLRLCYIGSMAQLYKAPDILIEAVAECIKKGMKLELAMVGDGRFKPRLVEQARRLGIADYVQFLGKLLYRREVFDQMDIADIFVLASWTEGLPRVMVEAMARGAPSIGSTVGGFPELLAAEDLVPPGDVQALVSKIVEVVGDIDRLERMSIRNIETVKRKFACRILEQRRVEFYEKVKEQLIPGIPKVAVNTSNPVRKCKVE